MSRSGIKLSSLLLNSVFLVIMTVMMIEIEEKSESQNSTADLKPNFYGVCTTPDPGIFAQKPNHPDDYLSQEQHPMIVPTPSTDNDQSESDFVIDYGCYQIARYFPSPERWKPPEIPLKPPEYKQ